MTVLFLGQFTVNVIADTLDDLYKYNKYYGTDNQVFRGVFLIPVSNGYIPYSASAQCSGHG